MLEVSIHVSNHLLDLILKTNQLVHLLIFVRIIQLDPQNIIILQVILVFDFLTTSLGVWSVQRVLVRAHDAILYV